ncbi:ABC-type multidrug transport system fused ATPase/permease subunit [Nocardioides luteus]|uniref:Uncharacterized protein n=1 Tax=Nocardioides luteus TaxID=1844 RepID=A0ABQ5T2B3_9ACTN|nr:hypothetical protein [Nocardioides luteus]MDR7310606.1 ABC-type multidrug transport system fused ATPase/permease subunit [Nocardioides luteus]GGR41803.1 hypothetical protein GCM10010197_03900 [Nocardioides luteus]GLJ69614.1 hypothetical protein GCM10017579_36500 [Nocardioides luteus]
MKILTEHVGLVASVAGILFVTVRLVVISGGSWETAASVLQLQGSGPVLAAALITIAAVIPIIAAHAWIIWSGHEGRNFGMFDAGFYLVIVALTLLVTPWTIGIAFIMILTLGITSVGIIRRWPGWKSTAWPKWKTKIRQSKKAFLFAIRKLFRIRTRRDAQRAPDATAPQKSADRTKRVTQGLEDLLDRLADYRTAPGLDIFYELRDIAADIDSNSPKRWLRVPARLHAVSTRIDGLRSSDVRAAREDFRALVRALEESHDRQNSLMLRLFKVQQFTLMVVTLATLLFVLGFSPVWIPLESVETKTDTYVGYVLKESEDEIVLLQDEPRGVIRISGKTERTYCTRQISPKSQSQRRRSDVAPAVSFLTSPRFEYPVCPLP